jgi:hypothetical protein
VKEVLVAEPDVDLEVGEEVVAYQRMDVLGGVGAGNPESYTASC